MVLPTLPLSRASSYKIYNMKNIYAVMMGSIKSEKKATSSRNNGKLGGYWLQQRNRHKLPNELNRRYERYVDVNSLMQN
jgi:hypothetical protein